MTIAPAPHTVICVDMGTTNTRVWIVKDGNIVDRLVEPIGLRDAARLGTRSLVCDSLRGFIATARENATKLNLRADCVLAAGMLTSSLGLREIPHISAPAGEVELARALQKIPDSDVTNLPLYLVPGIRSGPASPAFEELELTDLIRGEETAVVGLLQDGILKPNTTLLNLGSHWKSISIDEDRRIASSYTTLSGELVHALQTQTILASALPQGRLELLDTDWLERGRQYQIRNSLARTMFSVRLLEQIYGIDQTALSSFLLGAIVESDFRGMQAAKKLEGPVVISGTGAAVRAWKLRLQMASMPHAHCDTEVVERAFVRGLVRLFHLYTAGQR
jgi:2-dehydro-3-deoxygalactonokinase